ncbi:MAG: hypothetical protein II505_07800 [Bacteroidaceae bacterium]|nr:hypothetical protein [Bacteroidaceae bacterium]
MKYIEYDIGENEVRVIGPRGKRKKNKFRWFFLCLAAITLIAIVWYLFSNMSSSNAPKADEEIPSYFEPNDTVVEQKDSVEIDSILGAVVPDDARGFTECRDTVINDIELKIYIPHNAVATLHLGKINRHDKSIVLAAQAADIRQDNGKILGAFVLRGQPLSYGLSKKGFCAILDGKMTVGVADNSPLFEEATQCEGYFFRQYPLVDRGRLVESNLKGKSIRRALCDRMGQHFMVETATPESFHDFSQALIDLNVTNAIYLVGSSAYGWAVDADGRRTEWGIWVARIPRNVTYLVWRRKK